MLKEWSSLTEEKSQGTFQSTMRLCSQHGAEFAAQGGSSSGAVVREGEDGLASRWRPCSWTCVTLNRTWAHVTCFLNRLWTSCCSYLQLRWWCGQTMRPHFSSASVPVGCHGIGRMALVGQQQPCLAGVRCIEWPCRRFSLSFPVACYCCYRKSRGRNRPRRWGVAAACLAGRAGFCLQHLLL